MQKPKIVGVTLVYKIKQNTNAVFNDYNTSRIYLCQTLTCPGFCLVVKVNKIQQHPVVVECFCSLKSYQTTLVHLYVEL